MRQYLSIGLFLVLLMPLTGAWIFWAWQRIELKSSMRSEVISHLTDDQLECIKMVAGDRTIKWVDEDEFILDEVWYDVVRKSLCGDTIMYYCIQDESEEDLERQVEDLLAQSNGTSSRSLHFVLNLLNFSFIPLPEDGLPTLKAFTVITEGHPEYSCSLHGLSGGLPEVPPPQGCV